MTISTKHWDSAEHLKTEEDIQFYLEACLEEGGDDPAFIASGPTVGDRSSPSDARAILDRYGISTPQSVDVVLAGKTGVLPDGSEQLSRVENILVAAPSKSLEAAARCASDAGLDWQILGDDIEGEASDVAARQASLALGMQAKLGRQDPAMVLLSGGECTVTRRGDGIGGPNAEYALALALALDGQEGIFALSCDTDGVDGAADVAGALIDPETLERARALGSDPKAMLEVNDSHSFFGLLGDQVVPGPTLTNVNDFRAILIQGL